MHKLIVALVLLSLTVHGQTDYYIRALDFSETYSTGSTARTQGLAGAQVALGADLSSLSVNPAGLGLYRKSEVAFSSGIQVFNSDAEYNLGMGKYTNSNTENGLKFIVPNMGAAFCFLRDDIVESKWRGGTFAISMNRNKSFNNEITYTGKNSQNSMLDYFVQSATGIDSMVFQNEYSNGNITSLQSLAFAAYLINPVRNINSNSEYYPFINDQKYDLTQTGNIKTSGNMSEWSAGYGGNYDNKLFIGAAIHYKTIRSNTATTFTETNDRKPFAEISNFTFSEERRTRGDGVAFSLGLIYKINDIVRLGISAKSPGVISLKETYNASIVAGFNASSPDNGRNIIYNTNEKLNSREFKYTVYTPARFNGGFSLFFNKSGFLSGEIEYIDYSTAYLKTSGSSVFLNSNKLIKTYLNSTLNYKMGLELRKDIFRLMLGGAYFSPLYKSEVNNDLRRVRTNESVVLSGGVGFKFSEYFLDFSYQRFSYMNTNSPYLQNDPQKGTSPIINSSNRVNNFIVTFGGSF